MTSREYINRVITLQKEKNYDAAFNLLQEALSLYPTDSFLRTSEVFLLMRLGKIRPARQKAEEGLSRLKTSPFFLRTYIEILLKERDKEAIINITGKIKAWGIWDERLYTFLAGALSRVGERQMAIDLIQSGLLYMPGSQSLKRYLSMLTGSESGDGFRDTEGPSRGAAGIGYYRERFKDVSPDTAISEVENILFLPEYKDDASIRLFLAELYKKRGDLKRAEDVYVDVLKTKDSPFARKMLGFLYYRMGEYNKALPYLKDAFIHNPHDHALYNTIFKVMERIGNITDAE